MSKKKIVITGIETKRSLGNTPSVRPKIVIVPPPGVANWKRLSGPHQVPGGEKVTISAEWQCLELAQWRTRYSDGTIGYPVSAKGPWRLHRGPKEIFEFQFADPVNPRFIGEIITFNVEMLVSEEGWK
jgi:hypothetical protein